MSGSLGAEGAKKQGQIIRTLDRGLIILDALKDERGDVSLSGLTARFPWDKSTTHRLLATLIHRGYVEQDPETSKYRLGLKILELSSVLGRRLDIRYRAGESIEELARLSGETAHLAALERGEAVILVQTDGPEKVRIYTYVGMRMPAHCTALGKVLLAAMPGPQLEQWIAVNPLERFTGKTLTEPQELKTHLEEIRRCEYALDDEEYDPGIRCLACPVRNGEQKIVAGVGISGPSHRLSLEKLRSYMPLVKTAADEISMRMGFVP